MSDIMKTLTKLLTSQGYAHRHDTMGHHDFTHEDRGTYLVNLDPDNNLIADMAHFKKGVGITKFKGFKEWSEHFLANNPKPVKGN